MNAFLTQSKRGKVVSALLILLLAAAVTICTIGLSVWIAIGRQTRGLDEQYTTGGFFPSSVEDSWSQILYDREEDAFIPLSQQGDALPGLVGEDIRCVLGAYVPGTESITSYEFGGGRYGGFGEIFDTYSSCLVVLAARCDKIEIEVETEEIETDPLFYAADFTVLENLACHPGNAPVETVRCYGVTTREGERAFSAGKTYLLFGIGSMKFDIDFDIDKITFCVNDPGYRRLATASYFGPDDCLFVKDFYVSGDGRVWQALTPDSLPFYAEYTGSYEDFLNSEEGTVWRDVVLPLCEKNYAAITVMLTDNVNAHPFFNMGIASLLEGRAISKSEYENGDKVCLVSAAWADKNGVSVGDTIDLELYEAHARRVQHSTTPIGDLNWATGQEPLKEENKISDTEGYTVVGIYTAPEFSAGLYAFDANTVFAPKASVPNAQEYETLTDAALYSVIIENGRAEEFEEAMAERGYPGLFEYYDQGYSEVVDAIWAARDNAGRLLLIGVLAVVLAGALFLFLTFRRMAPVARGMRLLGVKPAAVGREAFGAVALLAAIAAALGTALGAALYGRVTAALVSMTLELPLGANLLCGLVCFLLVAALAALLSLATARQNLMQRKS